jgi:hypothetical protein
MVVADGMRGEKDPEAYQHGNSINVERITNQNQTTTLCPLDLGPLGGAVPASTRHCCSHSRASETDSEIPQ